MIETCKVCGQEVTNCRHFSKHGLTQKEYYLRYLAKVDPYSKEPIEFKNRDQYLATEFTSKTNMAAWLAAAPKNEAERFLIRVFKKRMEQKDLKFAPCHIELKTTDSLPNLPTIQRVVDYSTFCEELGLRVRFSAERPEPSKSGFRIAVDTREQNPVKLENSITQKLAFGDYTILGEDFANVFLERKNPSDFISTLAGGFERLKREIKRAAELGAYIVILVEKPWAFMRGFDKTYLGRFTQATPKFVFSNVRKLLQESGNVQLLFVEGNESAKYIKRVLGLGVAAKDVDLQLAYEKGWL